MGLETLAVASIATSLAGAGMSAYGQYQAGKAQNEMAKRNARAIDQARQAEALSAQENVKRSRQMNRRKLSSIRSRMAGSGVSATSGSSLSVLGEASEEMELKTLDLFRSSGAKQVAYGNQANMQRYEGKQAKAAGTMGAVGSLIGGVAQAGNQYRVSKYWGA